MLKGPYCGIDQNGLVDVNLAELDITYNKKINTLVHMTKLHTLSVDMIVCNFILLALPGKNHKIYFENIFYPRNKKTAIYKRNISAHVYLLIFVSML